MVLLSAIFVCNLCIKTLRLRLAVFETESSVLPRRTAPEAAEAFRESTTWGSGAELEARVNRQASPFLSLSCPSTLTQTHWWILFAIIYVPAQEHTWPFSFRLDDVLYTATSNSEVSGPASVDALPLSKEAWLSAAYTELVDI